MGEERRLLLIGRTGVGKSSTGNTILGKEIFPTKLGKSVTRKCRAESAIVFGDRVQVIDTPGLCYTDNLDPIAIIDAYISQRCHGIHAVVLVLSAANRPTEEEIGAIKSLEYLFGPEMSKFLIIVVTRAADLEEEGTDLEYFLQSYKGEAEEILIKCCNRGNVIGFDNRAIRENLREKQVKALLEKIKLLIRQNDGLLYSAAMLSKNKEIIQNREKLLRQLQEEEATGRREAEYIEELKKKKEKPLEKWMKEELERQYEEGSQQQRKMEEPHLLRESHCSVQGDAEQKECQCHKQRKKVMREEERKERIRCQEEEEKEEKAEEDERQHRRRDTWNVIGGVALGAAVGLVTLYPALGVVAGVVYSNLLNHLGNK